jgi:hypothetical protein
MHKNATKCNETLSKWCKNKHGASKIIDTFETYQWDYTDRQDSTRISPDELKEAEIDDNVRAITKLKKKSFMPKVFGTAAFSKLNPRTEVR